VSTFAETFQSIEAALSGQLRHDVVETAASTRPFGRALALLRKNMETHAWRGGGLSLKLGASVDELDRRTRDEGFHVLHDWDGKADHVTANTIVGDVLGYVADQRGAEDTDRTALAILVDYYFAYLLALLAMRVWDEDDPGHQFDRITDLLRVLQGPLGSGHKFADDAEMLMLIATSHYEPKEHGYYQLLARARSLPASNRTTVAVGHAHAMGGHLRFAYEITSGRSVAGTRDDNVTDYPWLCFALATLMDEYERLSSAGTASADLERIVEALANGLSADTAAFLRQPPSSLSAQESERVRFATSLEAHRAGLLEAFSRHRPLDRAYSPLSLYFNFSQNLVKGSVVDALLMGEPWNVSLNDLFTGLPREDMRNMGKEKLARTVAAYARRHPDTIGGRLAAVVHYDPAAGRRSFATAIRVIEGRAGS